MGIPVNEFGWFWHVYGFRAENSFVSCEGPVAACESPVAVAVAVSLVSRGGIAWFRALPACRFGVSVYLAEVL